MHRSQRRQQRAGAARFLLQGKQAFLNPGDRLKELFFDAGYLVLHGFWLKRPGNQPGWVVLGRQGAAQKFQGGDVFFEILAVEGFPNPGLRFQVLKQGRSFLVQTVGARTDGLGRCRLECLGQAGDFLLTPSK